MDLPAAWVGAGGAYNLLRFVDAYLPRRDPEQLHRLRWVESGGRVQLYWRITVVAFDRLGRSMTHVILTIEGLQPRGILLRSLREGVDFSQPLGKMLAGIFASLAEYERAHP